MHSHDTNDLDFAMFDLPARPGPCRKAAAEETDATAARLAREVEAAPYIAEATGLSAPAESDYLKACDIKICDLQTQAGMAREYERLVAFRMATTVAVEVQYGSGKVKV